MVAEILHDDDSAPAPDYLLTPLDAREVGERRQIQVEQFAPQNERHARRRHCRIAGVEKPLHAPLDALFACAADESERRCLAVLGEVANAHVVSVPDTDFYAARPRGWFEARDVFVVAVFDNRAVGVDNAAHVGECALYVVEVAEDVGVVELDVVDCQNVRAVVQKLAALVEKRGVVFVALDCKRRVGRAQIRAALGQISGNAADKPAAVRAVAMQQIRGNRRRGSLAVRAANYERIARAYQLRAYQVGQARVAVFAR